MGLDMYLYGVKKVREEDIPDRVQEEWFEENGYRIIYLDNSSVEDKAIADILPYSVTRTVFRKETNLEKLLLDNGLSENLNPGGFSIDKDFVEFRFYGEDNTCYKIKAKKEELEEKYSAIAEKQVIVINIDELAYWRKAYDLQDYFYEHLVNADNVTFCKLNKDVLTGLKGWLTRHKMEHQKIFTSGYDAKMCYEWY